MGESGAGGSGTGDGPLRRRYVHGPGTDEPLVWYEATGDRRYLHADERGSIVAVSDSAGKLTGINTYDEYGKPGPGNTGRFQYTGQAWLPEVGLYSYKARMYDPRLGRFVQTDPIGYEAGMNLYGYVGGDPVNFTDPWGLDGEENDSDDIIVTGKRKKKRDAGWAMPFFLGGGGGGGPGTAGGGGDSEEIIATGTRRRSQPAPQRASLLRRVYRKFIPDPCSGKGTNEGAGVSAGYDPYSVDEKGSLATVLGHVLPDHNFSSPFSDSRFLITTILTTIQSQPARGSGGSAVYTVNTGQYVGFDAKHGGGSDYITVVMGPDVNGSRTLRTASPGVDDRRAP